METRALQIESQPNKPIYFKVKTCFPKGKKELIEGVLLFTELDQKEWGHINCYTLRQIHKIIDDLNVGDLLPQYQPLGFCFAIDSDQTTITISRTNRLHVDNIWADYNIKIGESVYINKFDYLPYVHSVLTSFEIEHLNEFFWKLGISRQVYFIGSKV